MALYGSSRNFAASNAHEIDPGPEESATALIDNATAAE
jgi:hypothetical protein